MKKTLTTFVGLIDCGEIKRANLSAHSGNHSILINSKQRMEVYCEQGEGSYDDGLGFISQAS